MEETREQQKLHGFLQCAIYVSIALEAAVMIYLKAPFWGFFYVPLNKLSHLAIYHNILYSKLATFMLICLVSIGTLAKKKADLDPKTQIIYPLALGLLLFFGSIIFCNRPSAEAFAYTSWFNLLYMSCSLVGAVIASLAMDNISKIIRSGLGKDKWNVEGESFMQPVRRIDTPYSVNIPMQFYYKNKIHDGWINIVNPFRGTLLIGTPGSGKSFGVVNTFIRQMIAKEFCVCVYDFKFPDLGKIAYYQYLRAKQDGKCRQHALALIHI